MHFENRLNFVFTLFCHCFFLLFGGVLSATLLILYCGRRFTLRSFCVDFVLAYCPAMIINSPGNRDEKGEVCFAATNNCAFVAGRLSDEEVNLSQKYNSKYSIDVVCTKAVKKL